jgi:hypothetical protein
MKTKSPLAIVGLFALFASDVWSTDSQGKPASAAQPAASKAVAPGSAARSSPTPVRPLVENERPATAKPVPREKLPAELAASKAIEEANRNHVEPTRDRFTMENPPPPPRAEKKPPIPAPGMVWVPGHWMPVKGEWQWTPGSWGIPATPISVWIDAKYDPKTKLWSPGYWQPDRVAPEQPETAAPNEDQPTPTKFF